MTTQCKLKVDRQNRYFDNDMVCLDSYNHQYQHHLSLVGRQMNNLYDIKLFNLK